jgi:hypothetical protein
MRLSDYNSIDSSYSRNAGPLGDWAIELVRAHQACVSIRGSLGALYKKIRNFL